MNTVRLFIPGQFDDVYLYMDHIVAITASKTYRFYNLTAIASHLESILPNNLSVPTFMFSRNDWIGSKSFKTLFTNVGVATAFQQALVSFPAPYVALDEPQFRLAEYDINIPDLRYVLDVTVYNQRLYLGTDKGLFHHDFEWSEPGVSVEKAEQRLDYKCYSANANYGSVNASCGTYGLHTVFDEFAWSGDISTGFHQTAKRSMRTSWAGSDLVNYSAARSVAFLHGESEQVTLPDSKRKASIVTEFAEIEHAFDELFDLIRDQYEISKEEIQFIYNSNNWVFLNTFGGKLYSVRLGRSDDGRPTVKASTAAEGQSDRVVDATMSWLGLVAETDEKVLLFRNGVWHSIVDTPVISARAFVRSKRYRHVIAVVTGEGILLCSVFDWPIG